jgi:Ser/Thr protein kinase RdoA (MazF antagonist)
VVIDVRAWRGLRLDAPIEGGHRNEVWSGTLDGRRVAVRRSRRAPASLAWELDLLESLTARGFVVPALVRAADGSRSVGGVVVQEWIDGRQPDTREDWYRVAAELQRMHRDMSDTPQRPGCLTVPELGRHAVSVDADLRLVPEDAAATALHVFRSVRHAPVSLVHGDPCAANVRLDDAGRVALLDWDQSRVDVVWHDLSNLGIQVLDDDQHRHARRLSDAWEAVNAWVTEPNYARMRLDNLERNG